MESNSIGQALKYLGILEAICGAIWAIFELSEGNGLIAVIIFLSSAITCLMFLGFSEIINLLQKNVGYQEMIFNQLQTNHLELPSKAKNIVEDIEANLPEI